MPWFFIDEVDIAGPRTSITLLLFLVFPGVDGARRCTRCWSRRGLESWKEDRVRGWYGAVLSQACNARGHRSRNISCQAGSNGREGGQLDTDYPRSASDDPRGRPCKNCSSPASYPSRFHLRCLWRGTHKKEYVTSTDNSRFLSALGLASYQPTSLFLPFFPSSLLPFFPSYFLFFIRSTTTDRGYGFSLIYSRICLPADCERVELPARRDDSTLTYLCDRLSRSYGTILPKAALYTYTSGVSSSSCFHLEEMQLRERKFDFPFRVRCEVRCWSRDLCVSRFLGNSDEFLLCRISFDISKLSYTWLGVVASRLRQLSIVIK